MRVTVSQTRVVYCAVERERQTHYAMGFNKHRELYERVEQLAVGP